MVDITSLLSLQARSRRNARQAARALQRRRAEAAAAERARTTGSGGPRDADRRGARAQEG